MSKRIYKDKHINYLKKITPGKSSYEITEMFNKKFDLNTSRTAIRSLCSRYKIKSGAPKGNPKGLQSKVYPKEVEDFIKNNYKGVGPRRRLVCISKTTRILKML